MTGLCYRPRSRHCFLGGGGGGGKGAEGEKREGMRRRGRGTKGKLTQEFMMIRSVSVCWGRDRVLARRRHETVVSHQKLGIYLPKPT